MTEFKKTHHHMTGALALSPKSIKRDLQAVRGFNAKFAVLLTKVVGTMWCFYVFNGIAVISLPAALKTHNLTVLINWVSSNWIQLILLPALMVGQNVQSVAADARAEETDNNTKVLIDRLDTNTQGGITTIIDLINERIPAKVKAAKK